LEKENSTGITDSSLDYVFVINALFQLTNKISCLKEAYRVLGKGEYLVLVDWVQKISKDSEVVSIEDARLLALQVGFKFVRNLEAGQYHFGMLFQKN
jgi:ubiquinone/menaquinone biosynthesis C-methylase UbiE